MTDHELDQQLAAAFDVAPSSDFLARVRTAVAADVSAGRLATARVEGMDARREISLVRATNRVATRAADGFVAFARDRIAW